MCLSRALRGGTSALVSMPAIYNRLLSTRPDLLPPLLGPIATDRRGEVPSGAAPFFLLPVLPFHEGRLSVVYQRQYIDSAQVRGRGGRVLGGLGHDAPLSRHMQRFTAAPRLTPLHIEALDTWDALMEDRAMQVRRQCQGNTFTHVLFLQGTAPSHARPSSAAWS